MDSYGDDYRKTYPYSAPCSGDKFLRQFTVASGRISHFSSDPGFSSCHAEARGVHSDVSVALSGWRRSGKSTGSCCDTCGIRCQTVQGHSGDLENQSELDGDDGSALFCVKERDGWTSSACAETSLLLARCPPLRTQLGVYPSCISSPSKEKKKHTNTKNT